MKPNRDASKQSRKPVRKKQDHFKKHTEDGNPDKALVSTFHVERQNLTMRMHMCRFTRLKNAFSKTVENHAYAVALQSCTNNFVRVHQALKVSPAMEARLSDRLWDISDLLAIIDANQEAPKKPGPHKK